MKLQSDIARGIATLAHRGQYRRDGRTPYIAHPNAVADRLEARGADDETLAVAWLHDVLEDAGLTTDELRERGISERVASAVLVLTHMPDEPYENYLRGVKADPIARVVKVEDMLHNLGDSPTEKQILKYAKGLQLLLG
jgi:(p)ppGpp synthase/HD superfamily hydrolase